MTAGDRRPEGAQSASVRPDTAVDPSGAAPQSPNPTRPDRRRRLLSVGIPVLALVVLIATVCALGGFKERTDNVTKIIPGKLFVDGAYEFSFSRATVQQAEGYGKYQKMQKVRVTGTVRNLTEKASSPSGDWFTARARHGGHIETAQAAQVGPPDQWDSPQDVTPGLPATRLTVDFEFPPTFNDTSLLLVVGHLTYGTHSYLSGDNDQYWDTGDGKAFRLQLPLTRIAAEDY